MGKNELLKNNALTLPNSQQIVTDSYSNNKNLILITMFDAVP